MTTDDKKRKHARELTDTSAGGYDEYADEALQELEAIQPDRRTAEDNYRAGTILEFNLLNGETENAPRNVVGAIMRNYINAVERMAETARARRERIAEHVRNRANGGRGGVNNRVRHGGFGGANVRGLDPAGFEPEVVRGGGFAPLDAVVMIDHIEDFVDNDFGNDIFADDTLGGLMGMLVGHITETTPMIRKADREERRLRTAAAAENRAEAITEYMTQTQTHTSDAQNVHDSQVNKDLRTTLLAIEPSLRRDKTLNDAITEMTEFLFESDLSEDQHKLILKSLDIIRKDNYIGTLQCTEGHVFKCVWDRAEAPENAVNSKLIKEALAVALTEFWENGGDHAAVCINGRCSRMLASLTLLDFDDRVGAVQTKEMIKNEAIKDATDIINACIDEARASEDEARRLVGEAYRDPTVDCDENEEEKFVAEIKQKISNMMEHKYREKLSVRDFEKIRDDIYAGL